MSKEVKITDLYKFNQEVIVETEYKDKKVKVNGALGYYIYGNKEQLSVFINTKPDSCLSVVHAIPIHHVEDIVGIKILNLNSVGKTLQYIQHMQKLYLKPHTIVSEFDPKFDPDFEDIDPIIRSNLVKLSKRLTVLGVEHKMDLDAFVFDIKVKASY